MPPGIHGAAEGLYHRAMRKSLVHNSLLSTPLTRTDEALLHRLKDRGPERSVSATLDKALADFLRRPELAVGVTVFSREGEEIVNRNYRVAGSTRVALNDAARRHDYQIRDLVRAAIRWAGERAATQGPGRPGGFDER